MKVNCTWWLEQVWASPRKWGEDRAGDGVEGGGRVRRLGQGATKGRDVPLNSPRWAEGTGLLGRERLPR